MDRKSMEKMYQNLSKSLESKEVTGTAANGMVNITMNGKMEI